MPNGTNGGTPAAPGRGQTVYLGMSGGVDSALAAALLQEQGYRVHAVYMRNWSRDLPGFKCTWADDLADAERVAVTLGIDLDVWDCEAEYKSTVVDYLVDAYAHGLTPNPDVMCNQTVKFGTFARRAFAEGADFVATGHYARVTRESAAAPGTPARTRLLRAADEHKDQTYFLWRVGEATLARTLFPIGDIPTKAQVRRMCAERGLGVEAKPDSDGICFIGPVGIRNFLLDRPRHRRPRRRLPVHGRAAQGPRHRRRPQALRRRHGRRNQHGLRHGRPRLPRALDAPRPAHGRPLDLRRAPGARRLPRAQPPYRRPPPRARHALLVRAAPAGPRRREGRRRREERRRREGRCLGAGGVCGARPHRRPGAEHRHLRRSRVPGRGHHRASGAASAEVGRAWGADASLRMRAGTVIAVVTIGRLPADVSVAGRNAISRFLKLVVASAVPFLYSY